MSKEVIGYVFSEGDEKAVVELQPEHVEKKIVTGSITKAIRKRNYSNREETREKRKQYANTDDAKLKRLLYIQDPDTKERIRERKLKTSMINAATKTLFKCLELEKTLEKIVEDRDYEDIDEEVIEKFSSTIKGETEVLKFYIQAMIESAKNTENRIMVMRESVKKRKTEDNFEE